MSIRRNVNIAELNNAWGSFESCAIDAPDGTYEATKQLHSVISDAAGNLMIELRALGYKADACDMIREVEAVMYGYAKASNPDATVFPCSEGFGEAMAGPARARVLAQTESNRAFLAACEVPK